MLKVTQQSVETGKAEYSSRSNMMLAMAHTPVYVKALPLQELDDVESVKEEVKAGNILIVRVVPLARKSVEETKLAITELTDYVKGLGGDIARLGEERIVITPPGIRIWRREAAGPSTEVPIVVEAAQQEASRSGGSGSP
jgi:SepF-like predicted cell division protein (DUF552 family)